MEAIQHKTINQWPETERPRERLTQYGVQALSDAELIAILLRSGIPGKDAIALGRELMMRFGGLRGLLAVGLEELKTVKGLGTAKAAALLAAVEICRRNLKEQLIGKNIIRDPQSVLDYLYGTLRDRKTEVFKVLYLNKANCVIAEEDLFYGTVDEAIIHPREILKSSLDHHATGIVLVHNHPSGRVEPSREDLSMTQKIKEACAMVGIKVLDHIIVGDNRYFSLREHRLLA